MVGMNNIDDDKTMIHNIENEISQEGSVNSVVVCLFPEKEEYEDEDDYDYDDREEFIILHGNDYCSELNSDYATSTLMDLSLSYYIVGVEVDKESYYYSMDDQSQNRTLNLIMFPISKDSGFQTNITADLI